MLDVSRRLFWLLLFSSCVTTRAALVDEAPTCDSFATYDARAREQLDALLSEAPGEQLVKETARLNSARRTCARNVLSTLRERREADGIEAVQTEFDALTAAYGAAQLDQLVADTLGDEALQLRPLIEEARQRATREASTSQHARRDEAELKNLKVDAPTTEAPTLTMPSTMCAEATPCAQVSCVVERGEPGDERVKPDLMRAAQQCLDTRPDDAALAQLIATLQPWAPAGPHTEALTRLESRRRTVWPQVHAARDAQKPALAAQLAAPFVSLPSVRDEVESLRRAAIAKHEARLKEVQRVDEARWLQALVLQSLGGDAPAALAGAGKWDTARWRCEAPVPSPLPTLPPGLDVKLNVRCELPKKKEEDDAMRTFELRSMKVTVGLTYTCAGQVSDGGFTVQDPALETFPDETLRHELEQRVPQFVTACARRHQLTATASCTQLRSLGAADIMKRFVGHARFTHRWEPCFVEWFEATEGARLPPVQWPSSERVEGT